VLRVGPLGLLLRRAGSLSPTSFKAPAAEVGFEKTAASAMLPPGTLVAGRYEVVARLASGAMGDVYRVEHTLLRKSFALKVMKPALSKDATTRIGQQNIIEVVDFGQTDGGQFYFVMEFLDGQTLASLVYRHGPLPVHRVLKLGVQVARALSASHEMGVVHRDLKPENVMVIERPGDPDFVKVLDFGVAKVANDTGGAKQTSLGMIIGTPQYMAPEQAVGQPADPRTDIYALGLILYELAVGKPVFEGETPSDLMLKHTSTPPPAFQPGPLNDVPDGLEALVLKMLAKLPGARPSTMREVIGVLEDLEFELGGPRLPRPRRHQSGRRRRWPAAWAPGPRSSGRCPSSRCHEEEDRWCWAAWPRCWWASACW
jgi:eukaryotic-like serine/threonine-protein kinase